MTKKDFELIASTIRNTPLEPHDRWALVRNLVKALATTNSAFDPVNFTTTCFNGRGRPVRIFLGRGGLII